MRNRMIGMQLAQILALAAAEIPSASMSAIDDFYKENPRLKEEPQRTRYGGQKERERRAKRLAASKGAQRTG